MQVCHTDQVSHRGHGSLEQADVGNEMHARLVVMTAFGHPGGALDCREAHDMRIYTARVRCLFVCWFVLVLVFNEREGNQKSGIRN